MRAGHHPGVDVKMMAFLVLEEVVVKAERYLKLRSTKSLGVSSTAVLSI